jgi:hypothetical protein
MEVGILPLHAAGLLSRECANGVNDDFLRSSRTSELRIKQKRVKICKNVAMICSLRHFHKNYILSLTLRHCLCDTLYHIEGRFFIRRCIKNRKKKHKSTGKHIRVRRTPIRLVGNCLDGGWYAPHPPLDHCRENVPML